MGCEDAAIRGRCGLDPFISIKTRGPHASARSTGSPPRRYHTPARNAGFGSIAGILKDIAPSPQPIPEVTLPPMKIQPASSVENVSRLPSGSAIWSSRVFQAVLWGGWALTIPVA